MRVIFVSIVLYEEHNIIIMKLKNISTSNTIKNIHVARK